MDDIAARLPQWVRIVLVGLAVVVATGVSLFAWRYFTQPTTLTVAAGSADGEAVRLISAVASRLASAKSDVRLKVVDSGNARQAAKAFADDKVDLAVVRADADGLGARPTAVLVTHVVALLISPPGANIEDIEGLKGKTVAVVGGEMNHNIVDTLKREYDLARAKVQFKDVMPGEVQQALQSRQVQALLVVVPLSEKYLALIRQFFQNGGKQIGR